MHIADAVDTSALLKSWTVKFPIAALKEAIPI